jgi:hypothetical protein
MPIRKLSLSGKRRIQKGDVRLALSSREAGKATCNIGLGRLDARYPLDARVFVEVYSRQAGMERFYWGTWADVAKEPTRAFTFVGNVASQGLLGRIKVVAADGRLLGEADKLRPDERRATGGRRELLEIHRVSLQEEVWRLDYDPQQGPRLLLNKELPTSFEYGAVFQGLVFPTALREILRQLLREDPDDVEDDEGWQHVWLKLGKSFCPFDGPPRGDENGFEWVESVVQGFCRAHRLQSVTREALEKEPA